MATNVPPEVARAVSERVRSGQYGSAEEVFQTALRALEFVEEHGFDAEALRRELQEAAEAAERGESFQEDETLPWLRNPRDRNSR